MRQVDVALIGGGVIGLATAYQLALRFRGLSFALVEKERELALHQTGRNSGVIHSGLYYKPGSLKASTCRRGKQLLEAFCASEGVAHERCGKVVVATSERELPMLARLEERALANGVACERIGAERLRELEPHARGNAALHVPETGIVDYPGVCAALARRIRSAGGEIHLGARVERLSVVAGRVELAAGDVELSARCIVNCAGLHSDRLVTLSGGTREARIVPFRGEYFELVESARPLCRNLIYPVPDPAFPFLGVHFTRMVHGGVECGPNAVLALAREGYRKTSFVAADAWDALTYSGFWRLAARHWRAGCGELVRSVSKSAFVRALQRLLPEIQAEQLVPAPAGVRAQALARDGALVDDFLIQRQGPLIHVLNAPSPAATASLAIGEALAERVNAVLAERATEVIA